MSRRNLAVANLDSVTDINDKLAALDEITQNLSDIGTADLAMLISGLLSVALGGTGANLSLTGGTNQVVQQASQGAAFTIGQLAASMLSNGVTGSGLIVLATGPTIAGGAHTALTALGIRSTGTGAFDLTFANSENLTAGHTLTIAVNNADRTLTISGNATVSGTNTGDQTSVSGNAGTATALQTARTINGVSFDGTANITVPAAGSTLTDTVPITKGGSGQITASAALDALTVAGADIASASTTNIAAATGLYVNITGTATITAFGTATAGVLRVLKFAGSLTLTYNATSLILPGAANIATAANDVAIMESLGSGNWRCIGFTRAAVVPWGNSIAAANVTGLGTLATQNGTAPSGAIVGDTDTQTLSNKTLTSPTINTGNFADRNMQVNGYQLQRFTLTIFNSSGTLQHRIIRSRIDNGGVGSYAGKVTGASQTLNNTPTVSSVVNFTAGGGILSGSTHIFLLNTAAQTDGEFVPVAFISNNSTSSTVWVACVFNSSNVNGTTRNRVALMFSTTAGNWTLDTTNIASGKQIDVDILGFAA